jgi:hypothetical protein
MSGPSQQNNCIILFIFDNCFFVLYLSPLCFTRNGALAAIKISLHVISLEDELAVMRLRK